MKLLILGASGKIGHLVTESALARGHSVTALVLDATKLGKLTQDKLKVIEGDATNQSVIDKAVRGVDAIISVLGHNRFTTIEMQSNAMRSITSAMHKHKVSRIVSLTGTGVYTEGDAPNLLDRGLTALLMFVDTKRIQDGIKHVEVLKDSDLDWVVLRTPKHLSAKKVSRYRVTPNVKGVNWYVRRPNIVDYLVELVEAKKISSRMPVISG